MATRQNTRATVFHAIKIRMIIPVHIFTDKQRNQAHCLMYRYAPTLGLSSIHNNTNHNKKHGKRGKPDHKTKLEEPFWNNTSCHNHVQELQQKLRSGSMFMDLEAPTLTSPITSNSSGYWLTLNIIINTLSFCHKTGSNRKW
jgi:hypothetical protein